MNTYLKRCASFVSIIMIFALFCPTAIVFAEEIVVSVPTESSPQIETTPNVVVPVLEEVIIPDDTLIKTLPVSEEQKPLEPELAQEAMPESVVGTTNTSDPYSQQSQAKLKVEPDKVTGALRYEYPVEIPQGRAGLTPNFTLSYNSQNTHNASIFGYGWDISIPYIKRLNKYGVDKLYDTATETFTSSLDGELVLVDPVLHTYRPKKDDGSFHIYTYTNNNWSFTDKNGTTYVFGATAQSRQDDILDPTRVYKWNIETVMDVNTNTILYTYTKDAGQIYPQNIHYAIFDVVFDLENRTDSMQDATTGFSVLNQKRIKSISVNESSTLKKKYVLNYTVGDNSATSTIQTIQLQDPTVVVLNTTSFEYEISGHQWNITPSFELPMMDFSTPPNTAFSQVNPATQNTKIVDINGDGLMDILYGDGYYINNGVITSPNGKGKVWLNNGTNWVLAPSFELPMLDFSTPSNILLNQVNPSVESTKIIDINGDGLLDILHGHEYYINNGTITSVSGKGKVWLNNGKHFTNNLKKITTQSGSITDIAYKNQKNINRSGDQVRVVEKIITTEPVSGLSSRTEYIYSGGEYFYKNPHNREFAGFEKVEEKLFDNTNNILISRKVDYYHQGDLDSTMPIKNASLASIGEEPDAQEKIGRTFRTEVYDATGGLLQKTMTRFGSTQVSPGAFFVYPTSTLSQTFDPLTTTHKDTGHIFVYNTTTGNLTTDTNYGEVLGQNNASFADTGTDKYVTTYLYVSNATTKVNKPMKVTITDNAGAKKKEMTYWYDGLTYSQITKGNPTKINNWISGTGTGVWATQTIGYNTFGLPISTIDPNGNTTTTVYDINNLYPLTVTNPLGHVTSFVYDMTLGKPTKITDPNGAMFEYTHDGLGRLLTEKIPDGAGVPVLKSAYTYIDTPLQASVKEEKYFSPTLSSAVYTYLDSFGRPIQKAIKKGSQAIKEDTVYDAVGNIAKKTVPYEMSQITKTPPYYNPGYYTTYTYDALGRVLTENHVLGTINHMYTPWKEIVTDREGHVKEYVTDAHSNLTEVREKDGTSFYVTTYTYDSNHNLIGLTDALGNVRAFTHDGLGRRLTATDLHAPTDITFGTYTYTYDANGNTLTVTTPASTTTSFTYNALGQQLSEDNPSTIGTDIVYTYNTCTNGKGKLCSATRLTGNSTAYAYTLMGEIATETLSYGAGLPTMTTQYTYDRQGKVLTQKNPDNLTLTYTYNDRGLVQKIQKTIGTTTTDVIGGVEYNPTMQPRAVNFANGMQTINTYSAFEEYRLKDKMSVYGSTILQKLTYSYKPMGNIFKLIDDSMTSTKKTTSFTYDDLYRLIKSKAILPVSPYTTFFSETYSYNAIGNLLSKNLSTYLYQGNTGTLMANPHAPTQIGSAIQTYDALGNILTDGAHTNVWNYKNELQSVTKAGKTSIYTYDHAGNRIKEVTGTQTVYTPTKFYTEDQDVVGTKKISTVYLGDTQVATLEIVGATIAPSYFLTDHLGSTEKVIDVNGVIVSITEYYPYGGERVQTGPQPKRAFIGEQYDSTGYNYLNARYYEGGAGQFVSQDPMFWQLPKGLLMDPQQQNSYSYARDNPVMMKDPSGLSVLDYITGLVNAYGSNIFLGAGRVDSGVYNGNQSDYSNGQSAGDLAGMATGGFITNAGAGITGAGLGATVLSPATGPGVVVVAPAGIVTTAGGVTVTTYGAGVAGVSAYNFLQNGENNWGRPNTLADHTDRHAPDFGLGRTDQAGYAKAVKNFNDSAESAVQSGKTHFDSFVDKLNRTFYFDKNTRTMGIRNSNGTDASAYKPNKNNHQRADNYWNRQKASKSK